MVPLRHSVPGRSPAVVAASGHAREARATDGNLVNVSWAVIAVDGLSLVEAKVLGQVANVFGINHRSVPVNL